MRKLVIWICLLAFIGTFLSCRNYRVITEKVQEETREEVSNINPFAINTTKELEVIDGVVTDTSMELDFDGMFEAVVTIIKGEVELTLKNKDTIPLVTTITNKTSADIQPTEYIQYQMPKWLRRLLIISFSINGIFLIVGVVKLWRRITMPI